MSMSPAVALTLIKLSIAQRSSYPIPMGSTATHRLPDLLLDRTLRVRAAEEDALRRAMRPTGSTVPSPIPAAALNRRPSAAVPPPIPAAAMTRPQTATVPTPAAVPPPTPAAASATAASRNVQAAARSARRFVNPSLARYGKMGLMGAGALGALGTAIGTVAYMNPSGMTGQAIKSGYESTQGNLRATGNPFGRQSVPNVPAIAVPSDANPQEGAGDSRPQQARGKGTGIPTPQDQGYNFSPDPNVNDPYVRVGRIAGYALPNVAHLPAMPANYDQLKNTVIHRVGAGVLAEENARRNDLGVPSIAQEVTSRAIGGIREGMQNIGQQFGQYFNRR